jgi:rRNA maturation endonuclease Nob1
MKNIICACIECLAVFDPTEGQRCPLCGGEIRPEKVIEEVKPRAKK